MMKLNLFFYLVLFAISCSNDEENQGMQDGQTMNLEELEVGQKFYFSLYTASEFYSDDYTNFQYTGDTLVLEVLSIKGNKYTISESITPLSNLVKNNQSYYWEDKDSTYTNVWEVQNDSLFIYHTGSYFKSHLMKGSELNLKDFTSNEVEIKGWKTTHPYTESNVEAYTKGFDLFGKAYGRQNVYINNEDMQLDGPGKTTVYSKGDGIVRTSIYSWWTSEGQGWDRIK